MEPDDLLCSRNARPQKALVGRAQWKINQPPSMKREQASLEGAFISFDTRRGGDREQPDCPSCSQNAHDEKDGKDTHVGPVLPERAP